MERVAENLDALINGQIAFSDPWDYEKKAYQILLNNKYGLKALSLVESMGGSLALSLFEKAFLSRKEPNLKKLARIFKMSEEKATAALDLAKYIVLLSFDDVVWNTPEYGMNYNRVHLLCDLAVIEEFFPRELLCAKFCITPFGWRYAYAGEKNKAKKGKCWHGGKRDCNPYEVTTRGPSKKVERVYSLLLSERRERIKVARVREPDGVKPPKPSPQGTSDREIAYLTQRQADVYAFFLNQFGDRGVFTEPGSYKINDIPVHAYSISTLEKEGCLSTRVVEKPGRGRVKEITLLSKKIEVIDDPSKLYRLRRFGITPEIAIIHSPDQPSEVVMLAIDMIKPPAIRVRKSANAKELKGLSDSITQDGVIEPIIVKSLDSDSYELIAGERRLLASIDACISEIPAIIKNVDQRGAVDIALVENIQREDLNAVEEAEIFQVAIQTFGYSHEELAGRIGKPKTYISELTPLLKLSDEIKGYIRDGKISKSKAIYISRLPDPEDRLAVARTVAKNPEAVPDYKVRELVRGIQGKTSGIDSIKQQLSRIRSMLKALDVESLRSADKAKLTHALEQTSDLMIQIMDSLTGAESKSDAPKIV
ncbi:MAG: ParB/RepB/Spo0J family partition protein [Patescibacteria group bacterium]|nr:ParB/RepB/Spo0J family partition protein [Patescibacteria group bacterium]